MSRERYESHPEQDRESKKVNPQDRVKEKETTSESMDQRVRRGIEQRHHERLQRNGSDTGSGVPSDTGSDSNGDTSLSPQERLEQFRKNVEERRVARQLFIDQGRKGDI
jgi:hypothetical protein